MISSKRPQYYDESGTLREVISTAEVNDALEKLKYSSTGSVSKTLTELSQSDGKISATYQDISISTSQITDINNYATVEALDSVSASFGSNLRDEIDQVNTSLSDLAANVAPSIEGVDYTHRDSSQTSTISNGRLQTRDIDSGIGISKQGQVEPMGFTAIYNTGKFGSDQVSPVKQQTTVCINPNSISEFGVNTEKASIDVTENLVYSGSKGVAISLALMGYSGIVPGTLKVKRSWAYAAGSYTTVTSADDSNGILTGNAFDVVSPTSQRVDYENAIIYLDGINFDSFIGNCFGQDINGDDRIFNIEFDYTLKENYIYLPQKTGTIALVETSVPVIEGVNYVHREGSSQTTSVENGRVTCENQYGLLGQIEPMGMTVVRYKNGAGPGTTAPIYQKTTVCADSDIVDYLTSTVDTELYLPAKSGRIALIEDIPEFSLDGNTLIITLPE